MLNRNTNLVLAAAAYLSATSAFGGPVQVGPGARISFETGVQMAIPLNWMPACNKPGRNPSENSSTANPNNCEEVGLTTNEKTFDSTANFVTQFGIPEDNHKAQGFMESRFDVVGTIKLDELTLVIRASSNNRPDYIQKRYDVMRETGEQLLQIRAVYSSPTDEQSFESELSTLSPIK